MPELVGFQTMVILDPYGMTFDAVDVFCPDFWLLFKSDLSYCGLDFIYVTYMLDDRQDAKLFWLIISACFRHDCNVSCADVIDVIDGRKLFNQLLLTNLRNCNYFTHLPPKSLIFHHPCNQNSFHNNNPAYLPLTLNQEDIFQTYFDINKVCFLLILITEDGGPWLLFITAL